MKRDGLGLDLALLYIDLVATEHNGNILANTDKIAYVACKFSTEISLFPLQGC